jgi:hypothetical protein
MGALYTLIGFGVISLSKDKIEVEKWKKARTCMKIAGTIMIACSLISLYILIFMKNSRFQDVADTKNRPKLIHANTRLVGTEGDPRKRLAYI